MGTQLPSPKRGRSTPIFGPCLLWPNGWMDQDGTWYGGRPQLRRLCVRWGPSPLPQKGRSIQFSARVYCGQTAGCIKIALGMQVALTPGDCVRWGLSPFPKKGAEPHPIFGPRLLWPIGCMDQDATWYRGRPRPQPIRYCVRCGPSYPQKKGTSTATQFLAHFYCGQMAGWMKRPLGTEVDLGPGYIVLYGVPAPAKQPPIFGLCLLWPRSLISANVELLLKLISVKQKFCCCKWMGNNSICSKYDSCPRIACCIPSKFKRCLTAPQLNCIHSSVRNITFLFKCKSKSNVANALLPSLQSNWQWLTSKTSPSNSINYFLLFKLLNFLRTT